MKATTILFLLVFLFSETLFATKNDLIITIGHHKINRAEFERIYKKNNQILADESDVKSPKEYVEMYINFKLKVIEAMELKMDTSAAFREELAGYRKDLAAPYLTDMQYDEKLIRELYERRKKELNASHILFRVNPGATPEQEQNALQKALKAKHEILEGLDFNEAAVRYSEDPSAKTNKGNLGYFSAFQMVTPFENQAFNTPAGQVSEPVRTNFGYHLIKVHDIRDSQGEVKVAHIMKMFPREGEFDKAALKAEIDSVYKKLLNGASFEEMVEKHSDDVRSVATKGEMPWFSSQQMIPEFAIPAFNLRKNGDISQPVETPFGYHILKKIDHRPVPAFEELRADIEARVKKDPERSNSTRQVFIEKLKKEYGYNEEKENISQIGALDVSDSIAGNLLLFSFADKKFHLDKYKTFLEKSMNLNGTFAEHFHEWSSYEIIQYENSILEQKYPEFKYLMQEYHDGLLFFNIMEEKIWNFAAQDSSGLYDYYTSNKDKFKWEERFKGLTVICKTQEAREACEDYLNKGLSPEEVEGILNKEESLVKIETGAWEKGYNPIVDYFVWNMAPPAEIDPELTFTRGIISGPEPKTLDEAKGLYISAYQDYLEQNWIKSLRKRYKIKINKKALKAVPHA